MLETPSILDLDAMADGETNFRRKLVDHAADVAYST